MKLTDKARESLRRLLAAFEQGSIPEALSRTIIPAPGVPCSRWSLNNRLLAFLAQTQDARGLRQWNQIGRSVIAGRKAFYILAPLVVRVTVDDEDQEREGARERLVGFRAVPVFRVEDTEGEPLECPALEPPQPPPLAEVAAQWGLTVSYTAFAGAALGSAYGSYSPSRKRITLATHDEAVFFHELAHAAHERVRGSLKPGQDWQQEVVAELAAATLMHVYGRTPNDGGAYRYIASYAQSAGKDAHQACLSVVADCEQCLEQILAASLDAHGYTAG